ncbi:MAG: hypothetical protein H3C34_19050, partial [Caldilineaceae bacterium]|nr:hypothetical protein [Caldilineaceae bacterium]
YKDEQGTELKAAAFPLLPAGNYKVLEPGSVYSGRKVTVFPGATAEVDFR